MTQEMVAPDSKTLYAIVDDLMAYTESVEMLEGQLAQPLEDEEREQLTQQLAEAKGEILCIGSELAKKTDAVAVVLRRLGVERDYIHDERTRLKAKEAACERAEKWLRNYVLSVMQQNGLKQLKTTSNTLFIRGSEAVDITDASQIPAGYMNAEVKLPLWLWLQMKELAKVIPEVDAVRVHAEPSLSTIKKAIKSGEDVPGADLKFNSSLVCR